MQNNETKKSFDKKAYNKTYNAKNYSMYGAQIPKELAQKADQYRLLYDISKSEFVRLCIEYYLNNH